MENNEWPAAVVEAAALAIREEIVRQHRDNDISAFPAGSSYYEEHVSPFLVARAALSAIAPYIAQRKAEALERAAVTLDEEVERCRIAAKATIHFRSEHQLMVDLLPVRAAAIRALKQKNPDDAEREG